MTDSQHHQPDQATIDDAVRTTVQAALPATIAELSQLVRIPSVSWDAFDPSHVRASAEAIVELVEGTGLFERVEIAQSTIGESDELGQPAVLAVRPAKNGRKTVLLYAHHDVQPPGSEEDWKTPPFEPTLIGDRLYGRGSADDKAGVMAHLASVRALADVTNGDPDLGIVLFIEGEEEFGSRSFSNFLSDHREALEADAIVVADSGNWDVETPALTVGLRGNVTFKLTVRTLDHALHSGMFGGAVPDAMLAAIRLLSTFWDEKGSVAVAGLQRRSGTTPAYDEAQLREETGLLPQVSPIGDDTLLSRIWSQPAITVTGIDAPTVANASNTLLPSVAVRVSARIAPGQAARDAAAAIERHLRERAPFGVEIEIEDVDLGDPFLVDTSGPSVAAVKEAMAQAWGKEAVELGVGGSIPFIADLVRVFPEAEILVTGVEDPDSRAHSPNESLHLGVFHRAILTEALLLARLNAEA